MFVDIQIGEVRGKFRPQTSLVAKYAREANRKLYPTSI